MTVNRGLFVRNNGAVGTTPIEGRLVLATMLAENSPGVPRQGLLGQKATTVVAGTANMTYDVGACSPVLNRATNEGVYLFSLTGTTNVATTAAPGSGSRWDLIYVKQNDVDKGDANNTAVLAVLQGTSGGSPTKPYASLPAGAYVLAEAQVSTGATATNGAQVTITQVWRYTTLRGVPIPVRDTTERAEITPSAGHRVARLDLNANSDVLELWNGTAWESTGPKEIVFSNGGFVWGGSSAVWDAGVLSVNAGSGPSSQTSSPVPTFATAGTLSGSLKFTEPGIYAITWMVGPSADPGNSGYRIQTVGTWPGTPASIGDMTFANENRNGGQYFESLVAAPFIRVPQANLEVRLIGKQVNGSTNSAVVRVIQLSKL